MFDISSERPVKNRTPIPATGVNFTDGTMPPLIVSMTFRPTVHAPRNAKTVKSTPAVNFLTSQLPTAGPKATPVDDPPILNPTNAATNRPTTSSVVAIVDSRIGRPFRL